MLSLMFLKRNFCGIYFDNPFKVKWLRYEFFIQILS